MDVVYSIGPDDGTDYFNLRMSLRSVAKYAIHVGRVVIAGYRPKWLSEASVFYRSPGDRRLPKQANILNTIFDVIDAGLVRGEFLYSSDDHFLTRKVDFDAYPYYFKKDRLPTFDDVVRRDGIFKWKGYNRSLTDTRSLLERNGYGVVNFSGHVNTHMHTADAEEVRRLAHQTPVGKDGYEPTCLFMNVRQKRDRIAPTFREDRKIDVFDDPEAFERDIFSRDTFSVADCLDGNRKFKDEMLRLFPNKSRYEN